MCRYTGVMRSNRGQSMSRGQRRGGRRGRGGGGGGYIGRNFDPNYKNDDPNYKNNYKKKFDYQGPNFDSNYKVKRFNSNSGFAPRSVWSTKNPARARSGSPDDRY